MRYQLNSAPLVNCKILFKPGAVLKWAFAAATQVLFKISGRTGAGHCDGGF